MDRLWRFGARPARVSSRTARLLLLTGACLLFLTSLPGCKIVIGLGNMLFGPLTNESDYNKFTQNNKKLNEKAKTVVVLSGSASGAKNELPSLDIDVVAELSRQFKLEKVHVVEPGEVASFLDDIGGLERSTPLDPIGAKFGADYVVLFWFEEFGFHENNRDLYRGHAQGHALVAEMVGPDRKTARTIYNKPFNIKFPKHSPLSADHEQPTMFQKQFLQHLSEELSRIFFDRPPLDDI